MADMKVYKLQYMDGVNKVPVYITSSGEKNGNLVGLVKIWDISSI